MKLACPPRFELTTPWHIGSYEKSAVRHISNLCRLDTGRVQPADGTAEAGKTLAKNR